MWRNNQFNLEPGVYACADVLVVVCELLTHTYTDGIVKELEQPTVIYRDLEPGREKYLTYGMPLNDFNQKFIKAK